MEPITDTLDVPLTDQPEQVRSYKDMMEAYLAILVNEDFNSDWLRCFDSFDHDFNN